MGLKIWDVLSGIVDTFMYKYLNPRDKERFLIRLGSNATILDVGCGNDSPRFTKNLLPDCYYVGIDVADYQQKSKTLADRYIICTPEEFHTEIESAGKFDAVISSHNFEHVDDRNATLQAMLSAVRIGGMLYMAFPTAKSIGFPSRLGTLNYFDDPTHKGLPPDFKQIKRMLKSHGFRIVYARSSYKPLMLWTLGLAQERKSIFLGKILLGTWAFWGFESIIWAKKTKP